MSWPLASHFSAMLQKPRVAFRDPRLQQCVIEKDERNQPRPWAGAFAVVFKATDGVSGEPFAIRVFTTESPERRERYDRVSEYVQGRRPPCLIDFEYRDGSIRSAGDGKWYPLILMDWVQGETLFKWVRARALSGDTEAIRTAAEKWIELVDQLREASIAHGDLQHANVMVNQSGELRLVDYDCMCVPALVGRRNLEVGVPPYQHPARDERTVLSADLDNFSALVIYVALRALAAAPALWESFVERPGHDKLLFRSEDFQSPATSALVRELAASADEEVRQLSERLLQAARGPMENVPSLARLTDSFAKVEEMLRDERWAEAVALLNRRGQFRDAPAHLKPRIERAYEEVCRSQAWEAFLAAGQTSGEAGDRALVNAWNEPLFAGFGPAEAQRPRLAAARERVQVLDRLRYLLQQASRAPSPENDAHLLEVADQLPADYEHGLKQQVERTRKRLDAVSRLLADLETGDDETAIAAAWDDVRRYGGEASLSPAEASRAELAQQRLPIIVQLRDIPEDAPPEKVDRRLLQIWDDALLAGCAEAEAWRPDYEQAVSRREVLRELDRAVAERDEPTIVALCRERCLDGYPLPGRWKTTIRTAQDHVAKIESMLAALEEDNPVRFAEGFDCRLIGQRHELFAPHETKIRQWVAEEIAPVDRLGLRPALGRASVVPAERVHGQWQVRWTWPQPRFAEECILAVARDEPDPLEDPREIDLLHRVPIDRRGWENASGRWTLREESAWRGALVVVWAMIDLGFAVLPSRPLVLGRLERSAENGTFSWTRWMNRRKDGASAAAPPTEPGSVDAENEPAADPRPEPPDESEPHPDPEAFESEGREP